MDAASDVGAHRAIMVPRRDGVPPRPWPPSRCFWVLRQPWRNGRVGASGLSSGAHTQVALASEEG